MTPAQQTAAELLCAVARNRHCTCRFEHPYDPRGKLLEECIRCKALRAWEALPKAVA